MAQEMGLTLPEPASRRNCRTQEARPTQLTLTLTLATKPTTPHSIEHCQLFTFLPVGPRVAWCHSTSCRYRSARGSPTIFKWKTHAQTSSVLIQQHHPRKTSAHPITAIRKTDTIDSNKTFKNLKLHFPKETNDEQNGRTIKEKKGHYRCN